MGKKKVTGKGLAGCTILYKGEAFESQGLGRFAKDVLREGIWTHPVTGKTVEMTESRVKKLLLNTEQFLENGNRVPFPKGHTTDPTKNLGFWPGPFVAHDKKLFGVCEPKDEEAAKKMASGALDAVSVNIDFDYADPEGNQYDEVITHICATNYPVITRQGDFIKLDRSEDEELKRPLYILSESLSTEEDEETSAALDRLAEAFVKAKDDGLSRFVHSLESLGTTPLEQCLLQMKAKGMSGAEALATCKKRFGTGEKMSLEAIAQALKELGHK